jgi:hypothetical protein
LEEAVDLSSDRLLMMMMMMVMQKYTLNHIHNINSGTVAVLNARGMVSILFR